MQLIIIPIFYLLPLFCPSPASQITQQPWKWYPPSFLFLTHPNKSLRETSGPCWTVSTCWTNYLSNIQYPKRSTAMRPPWMRDIICATPSIFFIPFVLLNYHGPSYSITLWCYGTYICQVRSCTFQKEETRWHSIRVNQRCACWKSITSRGARIEQRASPFQMYWGHKGETCSIWLLLQTRIQENTQRWYCGDIPWRKVHHSSMRDL